MNREQYDKDWTKIYNKLMKLEKRLPFDKFQAYTFLQQVIILLKDFPNPSLELYIESIKDLDVKLIFIEYKNLQEQLDELRKSYYKSNNEINPMD